MRDGDVADVERLRCLFVVVRERAVRTSRARRGGSCMGRVSRQPSRCTLGTVVGPRGSRVPHPDHARRARPAPAPRRRRTRAPPPTKAAFDQPDRSDAARRSARRLLIGFDRSDTNTRSILDLQPSNCKAGPAHWSPARRSRARSTSDHHGPPASRRSRAGRCPRRRTAARAPRTRAPRTPTGPAAHPARPARSARARTPRALRPAGRARHADRRDPRRHRGLTATPTTCS